MSSPEWKTMIENIAANDQTETDVIIMTFIGYGLKFFPFVNIIGWILDLVIAGINFSRMGDRQAIFDFVLDPVNYPDTKSYLEKVKQYTRDFPVTRSHDLIGGTSYMVSVFTFIPVLAFVIWGFLSFTIVPAIVWVLGFIPLWTFFFIASLSLAAPSFQWLETPLFWMPRDTSEA